MIYSNRRNALVLLARPYIILKKAIMPDLAQTRIADKIVYLAHKAEDTGNFISVRERKAHEGDQTDFLYQS